MKLDTSAWKEFKLDTLFYIQAGKYYYSTEYEDGNTPYISASAINNGISQRIILEPDFPGNCIVIGKVGCTAFYQRESFCATSDVNILRPKNFSMNYKIGLFITAIINFSENYKWSYGRQCRIGDSKEIIIKLPIKELKEGVPIIDENKSFSSEGFIPDFEYMESYIVSIEKYEKNIIKKIIGME